MSKGVIKWTSDGQRRINGEEAGVYGAVPWPSHPKEELEQEFQALLSKSGCCRFFRIRGERIGGICPMRLAQGLCGGFLHFSDWVSGRDFARPAIGEGAWRKRCWQNVKSGAGKKAAVKWVPIAHWKTGKAGSFICTAVFWKQGALSVLSRIWRTEDGKQNRCAIHCHRFMIRIPACSF